MLDNSDNTIKWMTNSIKAKPKSEVISYCSPIFKLLDKRKEHDKVLELFRLYSKEDRWIALLWGKHEIEKACKVVGQLDFLCQAYHEAMQKDDESAGFFRPIFALFLKTVRGPASYAEAKESLQKTLQGSNYWTVPRASFQLADILVEEFRNTKKSDQKLATFLEMEKLVTTVKESMGNEFDATQSQTYIPLALMTRQIKPLRFQEILQATFNGCLVALRDEIANNDSVSFRTLAKVLACIPGLQHEASIAATCQLYVIDMDVYRKEQNKSISGDQPSDSEEVKPTTDGPEPLPDGPSVVEDSSQEQANSNGAGEYPAAKNPQGVDAATTVPELNVKEEENDENDKSEAGDLDPTVTISCQECDVDYSDWKDSTMYLCYYCTEVTLCEKCYNEKLDKENGKIPESWRVFCPAGHKHIKAPVDGWKGVKDGILKIGESEIAFGTWLDDLEKIKWPAAVSIFRKHFPPILASTFEYQDTCLGLTSSETCTGTSKEMPSCLDEVVADSKSCSGNGSGRSPASDHLYEVFVA